VTTGSGHLIRLDPDASTMTKHLVPGVSASGPVLSSANDLWGIAPDDDVVGYTAAGTSKVAMLLPKFNPVPVPPAKGFAAVTDFPVRPVMEPVTPVSGMSPGIPKIATAMTTRHGDGTYVEVFVNTGVPACGLSTLIASATADSPTAQIAVEIYNALGALVATSAPMPGGAVATLLKPAAGRYTARVRNLGVTSFNHIPTLVVREPALAVP